MTETTSSEAADGAQLARWAIEAMAGESPTQQLDAATERSRTRVRFAVEALRAAHEDHPA